MLRLPADDLSAANARKESTALEVWVLACPLACLASHMWAARHKQMMHQCETLAVHACVRSVVCWCVLCRVCPSGGSPAVRDGGTTASVVLHRALLKALSLPTVCPGCAYLRLSWPCRPSSLLLDAGMALSGGSSGWSDPASLPTRMLGSSRGSRVCAVVYALHSPVGQHTGGGGSSVV